MCRHSLLRWQFFSGSPDMKIAQGCHPEQSEGSAFPGVRWLNERFLTSFGMTDAGCRYLFLCQRKGKQTVQLKTIKISHYNRGTLDILFTPLTRQPCSQKSSVLDCSD